jgi:hypothetical protein
MKFHGLHSEEKIMKRFLIAASLCSSLFLGACAQDLEPASEEQQSVELPVDENPDITTTAKYQYTTFYFSDATRTIVVGSRDVDCQGNVTVTGEVTIHKKTYPETCQLR